MRLNISKKVKRALLITAGVLIGLVILVIVFISPIAKFVIEKYDEKFLGRQITLDWIYLNPFTGYAHINDLVLYEQNKDSAFVKAGSIDVNFAMFKLLGKTYEISNLTLDELDVNLIQHRQQFNFDDIIQKFAPDTTKPKDTTKLHFNLLDVEIKNSRFSYHETEIPVNYFITDLNVESPGLRWDEDSIKCHIAFKNGPGSGEIEADFGINLKSMEYATAAKVEKFDMSLINEYVKDLANFGELRAFLDADIQASGNMNSQTALTAKGYVGVSDLHFGKPDEDYVSIKQLDINMINVSPRRYSYVFDTIAIIQPFFKYERYDSLDNISRMFGVGGSNYTEAKAASDAGQFNLIVELVDFLQVLGKNFLKSDYRANRFALYDGDIKFNDYALREKFGAAVSSLDIVANDIDRQKPLLKVNINSPVAPHGNLNVDFAINPADFSDFKIEYALNQIALPDFNPYVVTYTSFPLKSGTLSFNGNWVVRDSMINSMNHLIIVAPTRTKRVRKADAKWLPLPLILGLIREPGNYVDYEIPVKGSLTDPKFKIKDVVLDVLRNIFVKPPTSPYRAYVRSQETEVEKFQVLLWNPRQAELTGKQQNFVEDVAKFLRKNPEAKITIEPVMYTGKEKEHIMFYLAKKKYYLQRTGKSNASFTDEDSIAVDKMSVKDAGFLRALDESIKGSNMMFTVQQKCYQWIDSGTINTHYTRLVEKRLSTIRTPLENAGAGKQVIVKAAKSEVPRTGFSFYRISYSVDIPDKLRDALEKLDVDESLYLKSVRQSTRP